MWKYNSVIGNGSTFVVWCFYTLMYLTTVEWVDSFQQTSMNRSRILSTTSLKAEKRQSIVEDHPTTSTANQSRDKQGCSLRTLNRRDLLNGVSVATLATLMTSLSSSSIEVANAADTTTASAASDMLLRLRSIPTFCIVDPNGVPFMIFDPQQASATGYFFLSFQVASDALNDARQKDTNAGASQVWSQAQIIVVPLAVALQLTLRKSQRDAVNNELKFNTFNDIVPSSEGVEDAKNTKESGNPDKWEQKGRVPLFYIDGLKLADGREPRYFNKEDLLKEWSRQNSDGAPPTIQLVEMVDLYRNALLKNDLGKVANIAILPVKETNQVASELMKSNKASSNVSYDFKKVYLVGSSKG